MLDNERRAALIHALSGLDWRTGISRAMLLARFPERSELGQLLRRYLPEGRYFSPADVATTLAHGVARDGERAPEPEPAAAEGAERQEPFDGVTPEGLGVAIRTAAGEFAAKTPAPSWTAARRSAIVPGWGQLQNGQPGKALAFVAAWLLLGLLSVLPLGLGRVNQGAARAVAALRPLWLALLAATYAASLADALTGEGRMRR